MKIREKITEKSPNRTSRKATPQTKATILELELCIDKNFQHLPGLDLEEKTKDVKTEDSVESLNGEDTMKTDTSSRKRPPTTSPSSPNSKQQQKQIRTGPSPPKDDNTRRQLPNTPRPHMHQNASDNSSPTQTPIKVDNTQVKDG